MDRSIASTGFGVGNDVMLNRALGHGYGVRVGVSFIYNIIITRHHYEIPHGASIFEMRNQHCYDSKQ